MSLLSSSLVIFLAIIPVALSPSTQSCDGSKDVRMDKAHPGVYLSFERLGKALNPLDARLMEPSKTGKSKEKGDDIWLRLHNNTCWPIQIRTLSSYLPKEK